ncbi:gap junction delta-4 protein-like [Acanthochromis polyacanthus]|uniref:gap junction delta-4 protein-like n=1 Tax=Acanthochromis polyacanthus TaxID=80966 RepID=UPI002234E8C3|nr:gap junction delta-4 protein-like [Acanthochromis polyacanthus]
MRMMGAKDILFVTISQNVSFVGKIWWMLMLVFRLLVLLLAGFTLFSDEQERFICNTIQPGCSNVCFDIFAPVSVLRLWLLHLILLCLPHLIFATYIMHKVLSRPYFGGFYCDRSRGGSPFTLDNSNSSRELSLHKASLERELAAPRFCCAYLLVVILRILLEAVFGSGQFLLFGLSIPKSFFCYEAPCTSGVECYISRRTEKTLMLNFMLGVAVLSILLSLVDLLSSVKAMVRWRKKKEMLMEEMSKGEQSSMFTATTLTEEDVILTRRVSRSGSSKMNGAAVVPTGELYHTKVTGVLEANESADERSPESKEGEVEMPDMITPTPTHYVIHSHSRPAISPRPDNAPLPNPRATTPIGVKKMAQFTAAGSSSGQQSDSSGSQDKRAWV